MQAAAIVDAAVSIRPFQFAPDTVRESRSARGVDEHRRDRAHDHVGRIAQVAAVLTIAGGSVGAASVLAAPPSSVHARTVAPIPAAELRAKLNTLLLEHA